MADKARHKIRNLLMKLNDEDRNTLCCLLDQSGICGQNWKRAARRKGPDDVFRGILGGGCRCIEKCGCRRA